MRTTDQILLENAYKAVCEMAYGIAGQASQQKTITKAQLLDVIGRAEAERPGVNFIGITQVTKENTNKPTDTQDPRPARQKESLYPMFELSGLTNGKTYFAKVSQVGGYIGHDYTKEVNRAREKEGMSTDFVAQAPRGNYEQVGDSKAFQRIGDQLYVYYRPTGISKTFSPVTVHATAANPSQPEHFKQIDPATVKQWKSTGQRPMVEVRKVSIDSIAAIKINGQDYVISDLDPVRKAIYTVAGAPTPPEEAANTTPQDEE
jgi:ribosome-binding protein aMBF1 (putative translation factor)